MARPTKKEIKAALDKLKAPTDGPTDTPPPSVGGNLQPQKSSQRIRKKGV